MKDYKKRGKKKGKFFFFACNYEFPLKKRESYRGAQWAHIQEDTNFFFVRSLPKEVYLCEAQKWRT